MAKYVSIDFGSRSVKVVGVEGTPRRFAVTHFAEREIPNRGDGVDAAGGEDVEVLVQAVDAMFTEMRLSKERVGVCLPAQDCYFREFFVPFTSVEQIGKVIKFQAEEYLPSIPIEDLVVDFYPITFEEERTKVLVVACPKDRIERVLQVLRRCEIDPPAIRLDITSLYLACRSLGHIDASTTCILVDLGARAMKIGLIEEGHLVHIRTPRVGTDILLTQKDDDDLSFPDSDVDLSKIDVSGINLEELEKELIVSLSSFDDRSEMVGDEAKGDPAEARRQALAVRVTREIVRTLAGRRLKGEVEKLLIAGGGSVLPELTDSLEEKLSVDVVPIDVMGRIQHSLNGADPAEINHSLPVGLGLGLRQMGIDGPDFDLRREEFRFTRKFDQVRGVLAVAICGLFCLVLALCYYVQQRSVAYEAILAEYVKEAGTPFRLAGLTVEDWDGQVRRAPPERRLQIIFDLVASRVGGGGGALPDDVSGLIVLRELFQKLQEAGVGVNQPNQGGSLQKVFIDYIDLREGRLEVRGEFDDSRVRSRILDAITRSPFLPRYRWNGTIPPDGKFNVYFDVIDPEAEGDD